MKTRSIIISVCVLLAVAGIIRSQDEEARRHLLHELGGPYFVSREKVQVELKLTDEQKGLLQEKLTTDLQQAGELLQIRKGLKGGERERLMQPSYEKLRAFLQTTLTPEQRRRFQQLELQYDIPGIMLRPETIARLHITNEQRQKSMSTIMDMQKEIMPLMQAAKSGGSQQEILRKVTQLRLDCLERILAMLNEEQRSQWKEMTGSPFVIW